MFRILLALTFTAIAFAIGFSLPLATYWLLNGGPGEPGGYALGMIGLPIGILGAVITGFVSFLELCDL